MRLQKTSVLAVGLLALSLAACSSVKRELGVARNSPDEFSVVKRAPLTLPPDYALRPPAEAGEVNEAAHITNQARAAVLGGTAAASQPVTAGVAEVSLLTKMGTASANPDIRRVIDEENGTIVLQNQTVADKLIFWNDEPPSQDKAPSSVVDPQMEAERLRKNKEEGKPVNEGVVPVIEKKKTTLDRIF